jgi:hypothetical protein
MNIKHVDDDCCVLLNAYQTSPSGEAFQVALNTLCGHPRCRAIFAFVTKGAPFALREDLPVVGSNDMGGASAFDTFEDQCEVPWQRICIIDMGPSPGHTYFAVTTPGDSTERSCLEALYANSADLENLEDIEIKVDRECCKSANRFFRNRYHSSYLQTQPILADPACSDVVNRELQEIHRMGDEATFRLCEAGSCYESIKRALSPLSNITVPSEALCKQAEDIFAFTCVGDDYRATNIKGRGTKIIDNVSEQCCVDSLNFFLGPGLSEFLSGALSEITTPVPIVLCNELSCRKGFSELVGSALIQDICFHVDSSQGLAAIEAAARPQGRRQVLQESNPQPTCGVFFTCAAETDCKYAEICYGGECADGIAKDDGQACTVAKVGSGVCFNGECVTNPGCVD